MFFLDLSPESNKTSSRAARSIAGTLFATQQFADSIPYFEAALAINPLFSRSWFILGCAYVKSEDWKDAVRCFRRVVAIEEDDAEGWANLASCYLRMGDVGGLVSVPFPEKSFPLA
jgi:tetratricopeptide (TPR) repeat protein